jgi:hypothetical protein
MSGPRAFRSIAHETVWATVASVDARGRPRSRVVHPVWTDDEDGLRGWIGIRPTSLLRRHVQHTGFASVSYWSPSHDVAVAECRARSVDDDAGRLQAWAALASAPEPAGYDPATIWPGPLDDGFAAISLEPWLLRWIRAADLAGGERHQLWRAGRAQAPSSSRSAASP